jgi:DNA-binding transcriptional regulator YiaG
METKKETFIFNGLGFPLELIDCPMKKALGEWVIDINLNALQLLVFKGLIHKPSPLSGGEFRFMRKFMDLTTEELGKKLAVSHAAVVNWEKEQSKISPVQDIYMRMLSMGFLKDMEKDMEINSIFEEIKPEILAEAEKTLLQIDAANLLKAI